MWVAHEADLSHMRWTVDTGEELTFIRKIYDYLGCADVQWKDVLSVFHTHPELSKINENIKQKVVP